MNQHTTDFASQSTTEALNVGARLARGSEALSRIRDADVDVGATPKQMVHSCDKVTLHHYERPAGVPVKTGPVVLVYGLIGRYTMADLQQDRSLVRNLLSRGVDLYVIDWGNPTRADQYLSMDDFIDDYVGSCVDFICDTVGVDAITLLGICQGGVFCTAYAALYPEKVKNLILTITPIDFHADQKDANPNNGLINLWTRNLETDDINALVDGFGNLPGEVMAGVFQMMTPARTLTKYNLGLLDASSDDDKLMNFLRMEKWLADRPAHPGTAARQWLIDFYKNNCLVKGEFTVNGAPVDLANVSMPVLNVYAEQDHIIPPACATALGDHVGTSDYTELALPGGHVGVYVSSKSQGIVGDGIFKWLENRP